MGKEDYVPVYKNNVASFPDVGWEWSETKQRWYHHE
jgi:hypothetical protein